MDLKADIEGVIQNFNIKTLANNTSERFESFDICYNYFQPQNDIIIDIEKSCHVFGFYLASWGMFRGSSFLLQKKNVKHFGETVKYIGKLDKCVWEIDLDKYNEANIKEITKIYDDIKKMMIEGKNSDTTLISKILLGVFGFIPAFDQNFKTTFSKIFDGNNGFKKCSFNKVNSDSLGSLKDFYDSNKITIDNLSNKSFTSDFDSNKTTIKYPKAKILDMYGFAVEYLNKEQYEKNTTTTGRSEQFIRPNSNSRSNFGL